MCALDAGCHWVPRKARTLVLVLADILSWLAQLTMVDLQSTVVQIVLDSYAFAFVCTCVLRVLPFHCGCLSGLTTVFNA